MAISTQPIICVRPRQGSRFTRCGSGLRRGVRLSPWFRNATIRVSPRPAPFRLLQPLDHPAIGGGFEVVLADAKSVMDIEADVVVTQRYALPDLKAVDALAAHTRT